MNYFIQQTILYYKYIFQVLDRRRGIPITLSALYQCIAYKLGVTLLPVLFPSHFLLKAEQNLIRYDHSNEETPLIRDN